MPIKVAVLGYGFSAKVFHLLFVTSVPLLQVVTILERSSNTCLQEFPDVHVAKSIDDVLANPEIQLVIITTVNHTHYAFAKRALEAGKHGTAFSNSIHVDLTFCTQWSSRNRSRRIQPRLRSCAISRPAKM